MEIETEIHNTPNTFNLNKTKEVETVISFNGRCDASKNELLRWESDSSFSSIPLPNYLFQMFPVLFNTFYPDNRSITLSTVEMKII